MCGNEQVVIATPKIVHFEDFEQFFIKASDEEKFLLFQHGKNKRKWAMASYWCAWCINVD